MRTPTEYTVKQWNVICCPISSCHEISSCSALACSGKSVNRRGTGRFENIDISFVSKLEASERVKPVERSTLIRLSGICGKKAPRSRGTSGALKQLQAGLEPAPGVCRWAPTRDVRLRTQFRTRVIEVKMRS